MDREKLQTLLRLKVPSKLNKFDAHIRKANGMREKKQARLQNEECTHIKICLDTALSIIGPHTSILRTHVKAQTQKINHHLKETKQKLLTSEKDNEQLRGANAEVRKLVDSLREDKFKQQQRIAELEQILHNLQANLTERGINYEDMCILGQGLVIGRSKTGPAEAPKDPSVGFNPTSLHHIKKGNQPSDLNKLILLLKVRSSLSFLCSCPLLITFLL
jgi:hypothetical protein